MMLSHIGISSAIASALDEATSRVARFNGCEEDEVRPDFISATRGEFGPIQRWGIVLRSKSHPSASDCVAGILSQVARLG